MSLPLLLATLAIIITFSSTQDQGQKFKLRSQYKRLLQHKLYSKAL